ncbi:MULTISPECIES: nitrogen regulation protein NR(I) [unclassified Sphingomonas]|uniref:nitrogen regulation protein NR(I) n=1 Tax=unclassified Sphingomonas TaxID=196159 RepID=UPI0006F87C37|nr:MULTISPECIES: nitrogen regulation protein NR(I) [unclassified Sphingomonas]KQX20081.1 nitrogen regulation protein NR(I) [Sphingomonas sp. Root1294]KQY67332.1 nitrogen regulation protein NR(I) [Sphingomonas sp. Root50]KRB90709.1 nitrogen regulation protein NR(I) [Sphingomonas sp. Root720]
MTGAGGRVLVVDDDGAIRTVVREALRRAGHIVETAASVAEQRRLFDSFDPQVLVTDVVLPDGNGLDIIPEMLQKNPGLPVIVLSAQNTFTTALRATEQGAFDYLPKPFDLGELTRAVADALAARAASGAMPFGDEAAEDLPLIGRSPPMQEVYRTIARVVANDLTVLVLGESGTGKELVARAIHDFGPRSAAPFVAINMAAIPRELIESELFGHERGAFTGAQARSAGRFEQAQGGTLFLDEIGDMPMEAQTRLLRVLQAGEFTTVGGTRSIRADVRIIAATHKDLPRLIADGGFREDLYYRLNVVPIRLPSLRQRGEDIGELARFFLERAAADGLPRKALDPGAVARLTQYGWPGNVRELENLMRRLAVLSREDVITAAMVEQQFQHPVMAETSFPPSSGNGGLADAVEQHLARYFATFGRDLPPDGLYDRVLAEVERPLLELSMAAAKGNQLRAARLLGINRNTLRKKLTDLQIDAVASRRAD